ncbi:hypothetical protein [Phaffia rhodozyma]|uniref:Uncharacterized protein n=1 Tax=Phaffia rhodozyma TaxID=264483 RepID=A0A0F7SED3_PHARH|nr:hypothetical protein [Phaffia rhodozyma]
MSFHEAATLHQTAFLLTHTISVPSIIYCHCSILPRSHHLKFFSSFHSDLSITPLPLNLRSAIQYHA